MTHCCKNCGKVVCLAKSDLDKIESKSRQTNSLEFNKVSNGEFICIDCYRKNYPPKYVQERLALNLDIDKPVSEDKI